MNLEGRKNIASQSQDDVQAACRREKLPHQEDSCMHLNTVEEFVSEFTRLSGKYHKMVAQPTTEHASRLARALRSLAEYKGNIDTATTYVEGLFITFHQLVIHEGRFDDQSSALFHPRTSELDRIATKLRRCQLSIVHRRGDERHVSRIQAVAEEVDRLYGWVLELEMEAMEDPEGLLFKHRQAMLMYQQPQ
ncbi:hypothetical protein EDD18DRAFT_1109635 [Armillaria luteobubalina]|uniref:Uncharacterized protein n=1 Tax=Armillaria luteobubalina TaxID=153913 RepID=A0AA39PT71_9AGAR|nr:hypothetical protein EDD18DRAFT_1109635 [Armillaria luteobubalina]